MVIKFIIFLTSFLLLNYKIYYVTLHFLKEKKNVEYYILCLPIDPSFECPENYSVQRETSWQGP